MKAIILISSIFYILGLKISNKIELIKKTNPVDTIVTKTIKSANPEKSIDFKEAETITCKKDSVAGGCSGNHILQAK